VVIENSVFLFEKVRYLVKQQMKSLSSENSSIVSSQLGENGFMKGAIALALNIIFEPPLKKKFRHTGMLNYSEPVGV
jgi:hypothetical protein